MVLVGDIKHREAPIINIKLKGHCAVCNTCAVCISWKSGFHIRQSSSLVFKHSPPSVVDTALVAAPNLGVSSMAQLVDGDPFSVPPTDPVLFKVLILPPHYSTCSTPKYDT